MCVRPKRTCDNAPAYQDLRQAQQALAEWERILAHVRQGYPVYDPEYDTALQEQLLAARRHQEEADHSARAAAAAHRAAEAGRRQAVGLAAEPLYTALARAGLYELTEDDHRALALLADRVDAATIAQLAS